GFDLGGGGVG
uniref:Sperm-activating peptide (Gly-5 SAP-I) n=1 Tax=Tripneustes gratilla TaxID=7673 RepID=Q7M3T8_TRIGR|nr:sperm-activating peptide I (5-Gly) [Tripneustes gratilla]